MGIPRMTSTAAGECAVRWAAVEPRMRLCIELCRLLPTTTRSAWTCLDHGRGGLFRLRTSFDAPQDVDEAIPIGGWYACEQPLLDRPSQPEPSFESRASLPREVDADDAAVCFMRAAIDQTAGLQAAHQHIHRLGGHPERACQLRSG